MSIKLSNSSLVDSIKWHGFVFKVSSSWDVWKLILGLRFGNLRSIASSSAEVSSLVHVLPKTIERDL